MVAAFLAAGHDVTVATTDVLDLERRVPADSAMLPPGARVVRFANVSHPLAAPSPIRANAMCPVPLTKKVARRQIPTPQAEVRDGCLHRRWLQVPRKLAIRRAAQPDPDGVSLARHGIVQFDEHFRSWQEFGNGG